MSLDVSNLSLIRGNFALEANFSLERGKVLVLLGPSGCGKTTLLRAIAGLEEIQTGTITLDGRRIDNLPTEKRQIGFVFQDLALFEQMRVSENIGYSLSLHHENRQSICERTLALARRFRIEQLLDRFPSELSGGERQRVAFARALASSPSLMLLDEPLSALDAPLRREMRRFIRMQLAEGHLTAIHVTHDVEEAVDLADEIIVMRDGHMVRRGTMEELEKEPGSGWLARFMNLGIVLPVTNIAADSSRGLLKIGTDAGSLLVRERMTHDTPAPNRAACLYIPLDAINIARDHGAGDATIVARIVRHIRSASSITKLVLTTPGVQDYYFELPLGDRVSDIPDEGADIAISIDSHLCQLLSEEP